MKLKKKIKRFFTLTRKENNGFTLVELIVVIAIIAILGGVGVPAYSGYVDKANKAADLSLASDVARAMTIRYHGNVENFSGMSYVVLTEAGMLTADPFAIEALNAAFGTTWETGEPKLKYDNWAATFTAASNGATDVPDSTFVKQIGTGKLMSDVQSVALGLSEFLSNRDVVQAKNTLVELLGGDESTFAGILDDAKLNDGNITSDALANATVFAVADYMDNNADAADIYYGFGGTIGGTLTADSDTIMYELANWYAANEALINYLDPEGTSTCAQKLAAIQEGTSKMAVVQAANDMEAALAELLDTPEKMQAYCDYYGIQYDSETSGPKFDNNDEPVVVNTNSQASKDRNAYRQMMKAVNENKNSYITADKLKDANLMTSGELASDVNSYVSGAQLQGQIDTINNDDIKAVLNGSYEGSVGVVYFIANGDGSMSVSTDMHDND